MIKGFRVHKGGTGRIVGGNDPALNRLAKAGRRMDAEEQVEMAARAKAGDREAHDALILANIPPLISQAKALRPRTLTVADLVGEGIIGMEKAIERYDPTVGATFMAYAINWCSCCMIAAMRQERMIQIPTNREMQLIAVKKENERRNSVQEPELNAEEITEMFTEEGRRGVTASDAARGCMIADMKPSSLDRQLLDDKDSGTLADLTEQRTFDAPDAHVSQVDRRMLTEVMRMFCTNQQYRVLSLYFGLDDGIERSRSDIAGILGTSYNNVTARIRKGLANLRRSAARKYIESIM